MFKTEFDYMYYLYEKYKSKNIDVTYEVEITKKSRIDLVCLFKEHNFRLLFELKDFRKGNYTNLLKRFSHLLKEVRNYQEDIFKTGYKDIFIIGILMPENIPIERFNQILELFLSHQIYFLDNQDKIVRLPLKYVPDKKNIKMLNEFNLIISS